MQDSPVIIAIRRPPMWSYGLMLFGVLTGALTLSSVYDVVPRLWHGRGLTEEGLASLGVAIIALLILGVVVGKRVLVRLRPLGPIAFHADHVMLPAGGEALRLSKLVYSDVIAVNEGGQPPRRHFFIESTKHVYHLPQEIFLDLDGPERFFLELRRRILALPQGGALLEQTEQRRRAAVQAMNVNPFATQAILGCIAVFFLNTLLKGALDDQFGLLRWGANAPALVHHGDYYRLFAANFLHLSWPHVIMNGLALYYLGTLLERLLGWSRFVIVYLASGFVAMWASSMSGKALMSIGASGAIFGLLGGFAVVSWRFRAQLPLSLRQTSRWWLTIFAINTLLPLIVPIVDFWAHIGGFVTGAVLTGALVLRRRSLPPAAGVFTQIVAVAWIAVFSAALITAVVHAARTDAEGEAAYADLLLHDKNTNPELLNMLAQMLLMTKIINKELQPGQLELADTCATEAVRREPDNPEYQHTLSYVAYITKDMQRALMAESNALNLDKEEVGYARQMANLLTSPARHAQDALVPNGMDLSEKDGHLQVEATRPVPEAGMLYIVLFKEQPVDTGKSDHENAPKEQRADTLVQVRLGKNAVPPFRAPADFPLEKGLTPKIEWWAADPNAADKQEVKWQVWKLPEE